MLQATHDGRVTDALSSLKADFFGHSPETPVILHRRDMVRGETPFDVLRVPERGLQFEERWVAFLTETPFVAFAGAIDKDAHVQRYAVWRYDPYHYCLEILLERYVQWLERKNLVGDVLIESRDPHADKRLKASYARFWERGNDHVSADRAQAALTTKEVKFGRKIDDIAGHQIADSLAHPVLGYLRTKNLNEPARQGFGARLIDILEESKFARSPWNGRTKGWGHKWLP